jgi:DNA-binding CsgD family transcriptional regulator
MQPGAAALDEAQTALKEGNWEAARSAFQAALDEEVTAEALQGLSQAEWWLSNEDEAVSLREQAHAAFRKGHDLVGAVRTALWLADEYRTVYGNESAANGWLTKAQRLAEKAPPGPISGWMAEARARGAADPAIKERYAAEALDVAEKWDDLELEAFALAQLGLSRVYQGDVAQGLSDLDEAMVVATGFDDPLVSADTSCSLMQAGELIGDLTPFDNWAPLIERFMRKRHMPLVASCGTCCGEVFAATGKWEAAEQEFMRTIQSLEKRGHRSRCAHPSARLAMLRIRQGRFEEAEVILEPFQTLPETVEAAAALHIARGEYRSAVRILERRLSQIGDSSLLSVSLLALRAQAHGALGETEAALACAQRLESIAQKTGLEGVAAQAALAKARAVRSTDPGGAESNYEMAVQRFENAGMRLETAATRLELAEALSTQAPETAVSEARAAHSAATDLGAIHLADRAAALLRQLGVKGQTGPKGVGDLTKREAEVLNLIAQGLTNSAIAERLFISEKTAANHVSNILTKLGAQTRTEAAAHLLQSTR